jgi:para-nitrobenzyl esterase
MKMLSRGMAAIAVAGLFGLAAGQARAATVRVAQGQLTSLSLKNAEAWLGVPYAEPPVGDLRWRAPLPARSWAGERKADKAPASCMQVRNPDAGRDPWTPEYMIPVGGPMSEDCLYLNVWTPKNAAGRRLPVYVFIHGGGNVEGSATVPVYDGANLAANGDIVVVDINYRLGVFGYLVHPDLTKEAGTSGNYGLLDEVAALQWVKANIEAVGGDPNNVTIGGQSAGAGSVLSLIGAPVAKPLFNRAIAESGPGVGARGGSFAQASEGGAAYMKAAGAKSIADLRRMPADQVLKTSIDSGARFGPVIDGRLLPREPNTAQISGGDFNDTPILAGFNFDEASGFDTSYGAWSQAQINGFIADFGAVADRARAIYMPGGQGDLQAVGKQMARDRGMATTFAWASRRQVHSGSPIFLYQYVHGEPGPKNARYGSFHTNEVPYVFQNLNAPGRTFTAEDQQVSKMISGYWVNFIKTGNPNGPGLPNWPAFSVSNPQAMHIDATPVAGPILPPEKRELYEARYALGGSMAGR